MKTLEATPILDWGHPLVARLAAQVRGADDRARLIAAHRLIAARLRPVYALNRTLAPGTGSCSQRLAVLEAVARAGAIATRVKGLRAGCIRAGV
ncbi:hypothetical protein [Nonomuraea dietziae]|uniref:hypothetical protein n=1 Tax=Nonomuraea dietziae TaxID=65515 RepID=UPI00343FEA3B